MLRNFVAVILVASTLLARGEPRTNCHTLESCEGELFHTSTPKACCLCRGRSFDTGSECVKCVVHGFEQASYNVTEGESLHTHFGPNADSSFESVELALFGNISSRDGTAKSCDYIKLDPVTVGKHTVDVRLFTINDDIALEYDDTVILEFKPLYPEFMEELGRKGEFIRESTVVKIIDNDKLQINFVDSRLSIKEGNGLNGPIRMQHRKTQEEFTLTLHAVTIGEAKEIFDVGRFIPLDDCSKEAQRDDFTNDMRSKNVTIPASADDSTATSMISIELPGNFKAVEDEINEDDQSFALVAVVRDVPDDYPVCFQMGPNCVECHGRIGATEIQILDNDPMVIGFAERETNVYEDGEIHNILVHSDRTSERNHEVRFYLLKASSNATLVSDNETLIDAVFGVKNGDGSVMATKVLTNGTDMFNISTEIIKDMRSEGVECFTLRISTRDTERRSVFSCNKNVTKGYFCYHNVCISDTGPRPPCYIGFNQAMYTVEEGDRQVRVCVDMECPENQTGYARVEVYRDDTPVPDKRLADGNFPTLSCTYINENLSDYEEQILGCNRMRDMPLVENSQKCFGLPIYNDEQVERTEHAGLTLAVRDTSSIVEFKSDYKFTAIHIKDNDTAVVGLQQISYEVYEDVGVVEVCAKVLSPSIDCPIQFPFNVTLSTVTLSTDDKAVSSDFGTKSSILQFKECETSRCMNITIKDDGAVENEKVFGVKLTKSPHLSDRIRLEPVDGMITIKDNDFANVVLQTTTHTVDEGDRVEELCAVVSQSGGGNGCPVAFDFSVTISSRGASAVSPDDYDVLTQNLHFSNCESSECVTVVTVDDSVVEDLVESFFMTLERAPGLMSRITLGPARVDITIIDDDEATFGLEKVRCDVREGVGTLEVCVVPSIPSNCPVDFNFDLKISTRNDSADSPADHVALSTILTINKCSTRECVDITIQDDLVLEQRESFHVILEKPPGFDDERIKLGIVEKEVTIVDDDVTEVGLEIPEVMVKEDVGVAEVCVVVNSPVIPCPVIFPFEILFTTSDITAVSSPENEMDYVALQRHRLRYSACAKRDCVNITIINDERLELSETFNVTLEKSQGLSNKFVLNPIQGQITIMDDDEVTVEFESSSYAVREDGGVVEVCAVLDQNPGDGCLTDFSFNIGISTSDGRAGDGRAVASEDYTTLTTILTFEPCDTRHCVEIAIVDDCVVERKLESFRVHLTRTRDLDSRIRVSRVDAVVDITDDDVITVGMERTHYFALENVGAAEVCAVVKNDPECAVAFAFDVRFSTEDDSADTPDDYIMLSTIERFEPEEMKHCVGIDIPDDGVLELSESFRVNLEKTAGLDDRFTINPATTEVEIINDDFAEIGLERTPLVVQEDMGAAEVCVVVYSPQLECPIVFPFEILITTIDGIDGGAESSSDYGALRRHSLRFRGCGLKDCVNVSITDDLELEMDESFNISLEKSQGLSNKFLLAPSHREVIIIDNDVAVVGFEQTAYTVRERDGVKQVCVTVTSPDINCPIKSSSLNVSLMTEDYSAASPRDYDAVSTTLTFDPCSRRRCTSITINNDLQLEADELFYVSLSTSRNDKIELNPAMASVHIVSDRNVATVGLQKTVYEVDENVGRVQLCAIVHRPNMSCPITFAFDIPVTTSKGDLLIHFRGCERESCVSMRIEDDSVLEVGETVTVRLERAEDLDSRIRLNPVDGVIRINDNDEAVVGLEKTFYRISEDAVQIEVCAIVYSPDLDCPINFAFDIGYYTRDDSADDSSDYYNVPESTTMQFGACDYIKCMDIRIRNDDKVEEIESFGVILKRVTGLDERISLDKVNGEVEIVDDDEAVVGLQTAFYAVRENQGEVEVCVEVSSPNRDCPIEYPIDVLLSTGDDSAVSGADYVALSDSVVEFAGCGRTRCVTISIVNDPELEQTETFTITLRRSSGLGSSISLGRVEAEIQIRDEDTAVVGLEKTDYTVSESGRVIQVCAVVVSESSSCVITFPFSIIISTGDITATSGEDYREVSSLSVDFNSCRNSRCVSVSILDDDVIETTESFYVTLARSPDLDGRIRLTPVYGVIEIDDDDALEVRLERRFYQVNESAGAVVEVCAVVSSLLECPITFPFRVTLKSSDDTAVKSMDYVSVDVSVPFSKCQKRSCRGVTIVNDNQVETKMESFSLSLERTDNLDDGIEVSSLETTVTIFDTDEARVSLERNSYRLNENVGVLKVCADVDIPRFINCPITFPFIVNLLLTDDTTEAPMDYTPRSAVFMFGECKRQSCVNISIVNDSIVEKDESFSVTLGSAPNLDNRIKLDSESTVVEIIDNDEATVGLERTLYSVNEDVGAIEVCVVVYSPETPPCPIAFAFNVSLSTATSDDYGPLPPYMSFNACRHQQRNCVSLSIKDDKVVENEETFEISLKRNGLHSRITLSPDVVEVSIMDNDRVEVGLKTTYQIVRENESPALVCAVVDSPDEDNPSSVSFPFDIHFHFNGARDSATNGVDFEAMSTDVTFEASEMEKCLSIPIADTLGLEQDESFFVTLQRTDDLDERIQLNAAVMGEIEIIDDDVAVVHLKDTVYRVREDAGVVRVCIVVTKPNVECPVTFPFDIHFYTSADSAVSGSDYGHVNDNRVGFVSCQKEKCIDVTIVDDTVSEEKEQFTIHLRRTPDHGRSLELDQSAVDGVVEITDND